MVASQPATVVSCELRAASCVLLRAERFRLCRVILYVKEPNARRFPENSPSLLLSFSPSRRLRLCSILMNPISGRHPASYASSIKLKLKPRLGKQIRAADPLHPTFAAC